MHIRTKCCNRAILNMLSMRLIYHITQPENNPQYNNLQLLEPYPLPAGSTTCILKSLGWKYKVALIFAILLA